MDPASLFAFIALVIAIVAIAIHGRARNRIIRLSSELEELRRFVHRRDQPPARLAPIAAGAVDAGFPAPRLAPIAVATIESHATVDAGFPVASSTPVFVPAADLPPPVFFPNASTPDAQKVDVPASFEERVGLVWFTRVGALVLLVGVAFFYNFAVDSGWLSPVVRVLLGTCVGGAILAACERMQKTTRPLFVNVMRGAGLGILYLVAWASYIRFELVPMPVAVAAFAAISLVGGALAVRARAEAVLVFSLLGGLLAPVLLSTGSDRPLALFLYLAGVSGLGLVVALRLRFTIALSVALGGVVLLALGWFATRFADNPGYAELAARIAPLIGTGAITAVWLAIARRSGKHAYAPLVVITALVFGHGCAGALLHDTPLLLGAISTTLAIAGIALVGRRELLAIPMAIGAIAGASIDGEPLIALTGVTAMTVVYLAGVLRGRMRAPDAATLWLTGGMSALFALVAAVVLQEQPHALAGVIAAISLGHHAFALAARRPTLALVAIASAAFALLLISITMLGGDPLLVAIIATWATAHLAAGTWLLVRGRVPLTSEHVLTLSIPAGTLSVLAWPALSEWSGLGLVPALFGVALLALGRHALAATRTHATALLGGGVTLVGLAIVFAFSVPVTVALWSVLAAAIAMLAVHAQDRRWLAGGGIAFGICLMAVTSVGDSGRIPALVVVAAALLASAIRTSRFHGAASTAFAIAGHVVALGLLLVEVTGAIEDLQAKTMAATLVLGGYAALLFGIGFGARHRLHRYLGLGLAVIALGKLSLADIWSLPRLYQTVICLGIGTLLVAAGFLYARRGRPA